MKDYNERVAFISSNGDVIVNKEHPDYSNGNLYCGIIFAYLDKYRDSVKLKSFIKNEIDKFKSEDCNNEDLHDIAIESISKRIASNYYDFNRCLGNISFKDKIKEKIFGYKGSLSSEDRIIQTSLAEIVKSKGK